MLSAECVLRAERLVPRGEAAQHPALSTQHYTIHMRCYVLAGGPSSRMGHPKETLELEGRTFLQLAAGAAASVFDEVVVVGKKRLGSGSLRSILDDRPEHAPIFGIDRALRDLEERGETRGWILAVDYPTISPSLLGFLRAEFESIEAELVVPMNGGFAQMLCAGYSTSLRPLIETRIRQGDYALRPLLQLCRARVIDEATLTSRLPGSNILNINTPEDLERLRRTHEQAHASRR